MSNRVTRIEELLRAHFVVTELIVLDDSAAHAGHAGSQGGAGHFRVSIRSEAFTGQRMLSRHRMVYKALESLIPDDIHALSIEALSPVESASLV